MLFGFNWFLKSCYSNISVKMRTILLAGLLFSKSALTIPADGFCLLPAFPV
jgi:hypothetical protein